MSQNTALLALQVYLKWNDSARGLVYAQRQWAY